MYIVILYDCVIYMIDSSFAIDLDRGRRVVVMPTSGSLCLADIVQEDVIKLKSGREALEIVNWAQDNAGTLQKI